jgi:hypothetical protein
MVRNVVCLQCYNMSIATGIFYGFTISLVITPALAALGRIVSDSLVLGNSHMQMKL